MMDGHMTGEMGGMMMVMAVVWGLLGLMLLALVVAALIWLVRALRQQGSVGADAAAELDGRYARGDLPREDYLQAKADLSRR